MTGCVTVRLEYLSNCELVCGMVRGFVWWGSCVRERESELHLAHNIRGVTWNVYSRPNKR
jgi:hypothetical protein